MKAPGKLETIREFVNTLEIDDGIEHLDTPAALGAWLAEHGFEPGAAKAADLRRARSVREALRALILANNGEELDPAAVDTVNEALGRARLGAALAGPGGWRLEPAADGPDRALGGLLGIVLESMSDGTWQRLKACSEHTCRWAFYDASRNRSGTWCSMQVCGNRAKARAFRERQRTRR